MLANLKKIRERAGLTRAKVAQDLDLSINTYRNWEQGVNEPKNVKIASRVAEYFGVTLDELVGNVSPGDMSVPTSRIVPMTRKAPLYGTIAAGVPQEMWVIEDKLPVPDQLIEKYPHAFFLRVDGDSMNKIILNGHYALIDPDAEIFNGDIVAVNINGYNATLKTWFKTDNTLILAPSSYDTEFKDYIFDDGNPDNPEIRPLGKMVWSMQPIN